MTTRTITALFDKYTDAVEAVRRLEAAGVAHDAISIVSNDAAHQQYHDDAAQTGAGTGASLGTLLGGGAGLLSGLGLLAIPGLGPVVAAGWLVATLVGAGVGAAAGGLVGSLTGAGVSEADAHAYAEGVRRGGTLVTVRAEDAMAARVANILDDHGTVDMDERETTWRSEGWSGTHQAGTATAGAATALGVAAGSTARAAESVARNEAIPIVEETLRVGKREVNRGRVRVHSHVVETPVNEQVTLHTETVQVERRPVNRAMGVGEDAFRERTIEAQERSEEAVVAKQARVTGEVVVNKEAAERTETVTDKVRSTKVEVEDERLKADPSAGKARR